MISKYNVSNYYLNKSPIINSILAEYYLISTSTKFDNGFCIYDLNIIIDDYEYDY